MPTIFDNIEKYFLKTLKSTLTVAKQVDCCVGYFNLRGWALLDKTITAWVSENKQRQCRLLIGMHTASSERARRKFSHDHTYDTQKTDQQAAIREKRRVAEEFREQLASGVPTNEYEETLRSLSSQLKNGHVLLKVYLSHPLHAKLYLMYRDEQNDINPIIGYLGSSNLTYPGLTGQGELNIDVLDGDACLKLATWFNDRWHDRLCLDISKELANSIDESWAREKHIAPYLVYLKIAYHLAQDARIGMSEFDIPAVFSKEGESLFDFQKAAVKIAAHHLQKRGGVLIGDVVGLGKSLMAIALAKISEEENYTNTLIICPKNLVTMWQRYVDRYELRARVMSLSKVIEALPHLSRFRVILIDESHHLRNKEGKRYKAIYDYIQQNDSQCILLSATPYNKNYLDLSAQLGLFIKHDTDLGIRPEKYLSEIGGESEFYKKHSCLVRSLGAFEESSYPEDWRDLMRFYMVRRTRKFIIENYARSSTTDPDCSRRYLTFEGGTRFYFPERIPKTVHFMVEENNPDDPYRRLYSDTVVETINKLLLPRYGLGAYVNKKKLLYLSQEQEKIAAGLSRAGTRLMGFCRTNLFKRLESGGPTFLLSIERHIVRNFVYLHAMHHRLEIPIGAQDASLLESYYEDEDIEEIHQDNEEEEVTLESLTEEITQDAYKESLFRKRAEKLYTAYQSTFKKRFKWLPSAVFMSRLSEELLEDAKGLIALLNECKKWEPAQDAKLSELHRLITQQHSQEKLLVFTQFADTADYLQQELTIRGVQQLEKVTGKNKNPTEVARRFSPRSNHDTVSPEKEIRILITTDTLSEGQNLQDCAIIVNYDLPWAIIRLIQRAGRVDRIGQHSERILCYSFVPTDGIERLLQLRERVRQRLRESGEVLGSDETFFDDDGRYQQVMHDLYTEKNGVLDSHDDMEVDLASYAYHIWKNATDADPSLIRAVESLPNIIYSSKEHSATQDKPHGVLVYMRTEEGNDVLTWVDEKGRPVTQSQFAILKAAACQRNTPPLPRAEYHHDATEAGMKHIRTLEKNVEGTLGPRLGIRRKVYDVLKKHQDKSKYNKDLFHPYLDKVIETLYCSPLTHSAADKLRRQIKVKEDRVVDLVLNLYEEDRLCIVQGEKDRHSEPQLICSMGLLPSAKTDVG